MLTFKACPFITLKVIHDVNNQGQLLVDFFLVPVEFKTGLKWGECISGLP
jgi:hypothetical protein